jgi:hypothetical protein
MVGRRTAPKRFLLIHPQGGNLVPRQRCRQVKKHKELSRKAHQVEKQQRRTARPTGCGEIVTPSHDPSVYPSDSALADGT